MNAQQQALYDKLIAFQFDEPGTELTFARRLARENGWSLAYAERVIVEYQRFLFLAREAGHVVTPSEQVDQAWHLHLMYTRSYWDGLCRNVLEQPLHHGPTKGGAAEQEKFIDLYNRTLASYERFFGNPPPRDIWSPASERFGADLRHVSVNTERYWIIPKPRWPKRPRMGTFSPSTTPLMALGIVGLPLAAAWNPLDWNGPEFLQFYLVWAAIAAVAALLTRLLRLPESAPLDFSNRQELDPYEAACLAQGPGQAMHAAFASMVHSGTLVLVDHDTKVLGGLLKRNVTTIEQGTPPAKNAPRLEQALFAGAASPATDFTPLALTGKSVTLEIADNLTMRGLLRSASAWPAASCFIASAIMASPLLVGVPKIIVGLSRERPVLYLVAACVVTVIASLIFLFARSRLTPAGRAMLADLQQKHSNKTRFSQVGAASLQPADVAMAVGLFGATVLATGPLSNIHAALPRHDATSSSGGGGCGSAGCGGGGCGGGCGGCGG